MNSMARRMFELVEPIGVIPYSASEPNEAMFALGFTNYWDTYFAGRAAPLGLAAAEVVDALFYNFAPASAVRITSQITLGSSPLVARTFSPARLNAVGAGPPAPAGEPSPLALRRARRPG